MAAEPQPNRIKVAVLLCAIAGAAVLPFACDNQPEPKTTSRPATTSTPARAPSTAQTGDAPRQPAAPPGEIRWTKPGPWKEVPSTSAMRKATYQIAKASGDSDDGELTVIVAGGSTEANIQRWEGQFGGAKAKVSTKAPRGVNVTIAEIEGEFAGGGPMMGGGGEKKPGFVMLAAIVDGADGQKYFFKLVGPKKTIESARGDFDALVDSITR
jgi:hypothetical protein